MTESQFTRRTETLAWLILAALVAGIALLSAAAHHLLTSFQWN